MDLEAEFKKATAEKAKSHLAGPQSDGEGESS